MYGLYISKISLVLYIRVPTYSRMYTYIHMFNISYHDQKIRVLTAGQLSLHLPLLYAGTVIAHSFFPYHHNMYVIYITKKHKMNVVEQDKSGIQNLLHSWHKKKTIKCPTCKETLFHFDGTPHFSSVCVINEITIGNC